MSSRFPNSGPRPGTIRTVATIGIAAIADGLQIAFPAMWIPISLIAAAIFFLLWGWRWEILVVLLPELAPIVGLVPTWTAVAIYLTRKEMKSEDDPEPIDPPAMRDVGPRKKSQ